jgi:curved DNA-binding protein CbpA
MNGLLTEHSLAELIKEASELKLSGALRVTKNPIKIVIFFRSGSLVLASSNLRPHRLIEMIRQSSMVSEEHSHLLQDNLTDSALLKGLLTNGALTEDQITKILLKQAVSVITPVLLWTEGEWSFERDARLTTERQIDLKTRELLLESGRRLPSEYIKRRFTDPGEKISQSTTKATPGLLTPIEESLLKAVETPSTVEALTGASSGEDERTRALFSLYLAGIVERQLRSSAFNSKRVTSEAVSVKAESNGDDQSEIEALLELGEITDLYKVLGLTNSCSSSDIKRAYYSLAKRFHPDRFRSATDSATHKRVETAFARISEAYDTLKDSSSRAAYDKEAIKPKESQPARQVERGADVLSRASALLPSAPEAEEVAREAHLYGTEMMERENLPLALACFEQSVRLAPKEAPYHAALGKVLSQSKSTRHKAEAAFLSAISNDPANALYRVRLADFYLEVGLMKRAEGELERALAIDPGHKEVKELAERVRLASKSQGRRK